jgi:hypothetical protein
LPLHRLSQADVSLAQSNAVDHPILLMCAQVFVYKDCQMGSYKISNANMCNAATKL